MRLAVYDVLGKEIAVLQNGLHQMGSYNVQFDASGLSSGVYFYKLETAEKLLTKKMVLVQ